MPNLKVSLSEKKDYIVTENFYTRVYLDSALKKNPATFKVEIPAYTSKGNLEKYPVIIFSSNPSIDKAFVEFNKQYSDLYQYLGPRPKSSVAQTWRKVGANIGKSILNYGREQLGGSRVQPRNAS